MSIKENATISIDGSDLDFCSVYVIDFIGSYGRFTGQKIKEYIIGICHFGDMKYVVEDLSTIS